MYSFYDPKLIAKINIMSIAQCNVATHTSWRNGDESMRLQLNLLSMHMTVAYINGLNVEYLFLPLQDLCVKHDGRKAIASYD